MRTDAGSRLTLIFDGDDTLWENNVYFEQAIDEFIAFLDHSTLTPGEVRATLDEIERANIQIHGYGARAFAHSLREVYTHLAERHLDEDALATIMGFAERILSQPIELLPGVEETLVELRERHRVVLLTKGHAEEQRLKIERSGLENHFDRAFVVPEKEVAVYHQVVVDLASDPRQTWMIGNSPRSDINPAIAAGLNAVFIPHDQTWRLEAEEIAHEGDRLLILDSFRRLRDHF